MKFRAIVAILTISIFVLFALVVKYSYDLKISESKLLESNTELKQQKDEIDSLYEVNKSHLEALSRATDSIYFNVAKTTNSFKSYKSYLSNFGQEGDYYIKTLVNINALYPKTGYVQLKESSGRTLYKKFEDTKGFPDEPVMLDGVPSISKNNLYISNMDMNVRNGVMGKPEFPNTSRNGDVIFRNQMVKVIGEVIESGSTKWVHIAYGNR